jgi:hypothetical protein
MFRVYEFFPIDGFRYSRVYDNIEYAILYINNSLEVIDLEHNIIEKTILNGGREYVFTMADGTQGGFLIKWEQI